MLRYKLIMFPFLLLLLTGLLFQNCTSGFDVYEVGYVDLSSTNNTNVKADVNLSESFGNLIHPADVISWLGQSSGTELSVALPGLALLQNSILSTPKIIYNNDKECVVTSIKDLSDISACEILTFAVENIRISTSIHLDHKILVRGRLNKAKKPNTTIEFANRVLPLFDITANDVAIEDLIAVGNADVVDLESVTTENSFIKISDGLSNFVFNNLHVSKFNLGIDINHAVNINLPSYVLKYTNNVVIQNCNLSTLGTTAISARYVKDLFIVNNSVANVWGRIKNGSLLAIADGIYLFGVGNALIQNNNLSGIRRMGIVLEGDEEFKTDFDYTSHLTENIFIIDNNITEIFGSRGTVFGSGAAETITPEFNAGIWAEYGKYKPYSVVIFKNRIVNSLDLNSPVKTHPSANASIGIFGSGLALIENDISGFGQAFVGISSLLLDNQLRNSSGLTEYGELSAAIKINVQKTLTQVNIDKNKLKDKCNLLVINHVLANSEVCINAVDAAFSLKGYAVIKGNHFIGNSASAIRVTNSDGEIKIQDNTFSNNFNHSADSLSSTSDSFEKAEIVIYKASSDGLLYEISGNTFDMTHGFPAIATIANMNELKFGCRGVINNNLYSDSASGSLIVKTYTFGNVTNAAEVTDVSASSLSESSFFSVSDLTKGKKLFRYDSIIAGTAAKKSWKKIEYYKKVPRTVSIYSSYLPTISFSRTVTSVVENSNAEKNYCTEVTAQ